MSAILWIHPFPLSSAIFDAQREINGRTRHIVPDLPGFGDEPAPEDDWSIDDYARFVIARLDREEVDRAILAGVSMGGYICLAIARIAPERISGLVLIDTRETPDTDEARQGRFESIEKVKREGVKPVVDSMLPKMLTPDAPQAMRDRVREIMMSSSPAGVIAALGAMANRPDSAPILPRMTMPVLVVVGEQDTITPPADAERMAQAIPNATLVRIPGAAHLSNVEQAKAFNDAIIQWSSTLQPDEP